MTNQLTVYELIQMLTEKPADATVKFQLNDNAEEGDELYYLERDDSRSDAITFLLGV